MDIRVLRPDDIPHVQLANITNLPENYFCKYYLYHALSWPQLSYVAVDVSAPAYIAKSFNRTPHACPLLVNARPQGLRRCGSGSWRKPRVARSMKCR